MTDDGVRRVTTTKTEGVITVRITVGALTPPAIKVSTDMSSSRPSQSVNAK